MIIWDMRKWLLLSVTHYLTARPLVALYAVPDCEISGSRSNRVIWQSINAAAARHVTETRSTPFQSFTTNTRHSACFHPTGQANHAHCVIKSRHSKRAIQSRESISSGGSLIVNDWKVHCNFCDSHENIRGLKNCDYHVKWNLFL